MRRVYKRDTPNFQPQFTLQFFSSAVTTMKIVLAVAVLVVLAVVDAQQGQQPVPIVSYVNNLNPDGSYNFAYETGDGIARQESGAQKQVSAEASGQTSQGSVSWRTPDGKTVTLTFVADENGYQPKVTIS